MPARKNFQPPSPEEGLLVTTENLEQLQRQQGIIEQLLRLTFTGASLAEQLSLALDILTDIPWMPFTAKGGIFLVDPAVPETLILSVGKSIPQSLRDHCGRLKFGECLCGLAARERKFIFTPSLPARQKIRYGSMEDQSHYIVPVILGEHLLGILMLYGQAGHPSNENERQFLETAASTLALLIERQQTADRLRVSEENLSRAQRIAQLGYWDWDVRNNRITRSREVFEIFGTAPRDEPATFEYFLSLVHPDDVATVRDSLQTALATNSRYSLSHRILRPDGGIRIVHGEGDVALAEDGKPSRIFGTVQDITLLKHSEQQLHLAAQVFDSSIEGITVTDANGMIQSVNRAFTHITGYSPEEAVGHRPSILKSDRHDAPFYQAMWQTLLATGRWEGEIWNRRKSGEVYPEWLTITAITDDFGQVSHHVAVFHDMSEVRGFEEKLHFQAHHDALTSLPNRTLLLDRLAVAIGHAQQTGKQVAVLAIDLDNFKHVNDSLGHTVGDLLLQQVGERLKACLPRDTTIARLGGDDFAVLLEQLANTQDAIPLAETITAAFARPFNLSIYETVITVSIGITFFPGDGEDAGNLLKNAELAMYRAKEDGKNKYQLFTKTMNAQVMHRLSLENNLRKALDRREFLVYYQPKISLATGAIVGMEALARWRTPDGGLISPLDFIPLAEETGLIIPLGEQVLRQACLDAGTWLRDYAGHLIMSVNLSPKQFRQTDLLATVTAILEETDFPPERLELEITESAVMANEQAAIALLLELKGLGVRLALDDFGTGYSSLHYLRKLPFDTIKMDRSFVKDLPDDPSSVAIAITILTLANSLGMEVVAEGVETVEQLEFLRSRNCSEIQGFLFSPPVEAGAFSVMLRDKRGLPLPQVLAGKNTQPFPLDQ